jgi:hypothetical protein
VEGKQLMQDSTLACYIHLDLLFSHVFLHADMMDHVQPLVWWSTSKNNWKRMLHMQE